jgi:endonuclease YncB( thermonuclease family)
MTCSGELIRDEISPTILLVIGNIDRSQAGEISGIPRIVDGDTVQIGETKIRLQGIDPHSSQLARFRAT